MRLGFGQLLLVTSGMHPGVEARLIEARLKYFQRMPFPSGIERVGSGGRTDYPAEDVVMLITVFELLAAGIAPLLAASVVGAAQGGLVPFVANTWMNRTTETDALLLVQPDGFEAKRGGAGELFVGRKLDLDIWTRKRGDAARRVVVVNAARMTSQLDTAFENLASMAPLAPARARAGFDAWAEDTAAAAAARSRTGT